MSVKSSFYAVTSCTVGLSHMKVVDVRDKLFETCWVMFKLWCTDFDYYECIEGVLGSCDPQLHTLYKCLKRSSILKNTSISDVKCV